MAEKRKPLPELPAPWQGLGIEIDDVIEVKWADPACHPRQATVLYTDYRDGTPFVTTGSGVPSFPLVAGDIVLKVRKAR